MKTLRAFLAVNLPVPVVRRLMEEVRTLQPAVRAAALEVAWVPAANVHLTLKFLGSIDPALIDAIRGALVRGLPAHPSFELEAQGLGAFPSAARPRILWAALRASAPLQALEQAIALWMEELGFGREERPFHPHLTLGRVKHGEGSLEALLGERGNVSFGGGQVTEVVLYESRTLRAGAEYHALARVPLGGASSALGKTKESSTDTRNG